ncbi:MAG: GntR family transcriptional regulator [Chloroflexota bacterium]|nr:GntR family transcriptional regulator [Chloroflexota bacterium]
MPSTYRLSKINESISLKDRAYGAIKDAILTLQLEPGTLIVETQLAEELGISKTPVRDALHELERQGFVTRVPFKGTYVTEVTPQDLTDVFQLRAVMEGLAARRATPFFSAEELDHVDECLTAAEAALADGDLALCSQRGKALHDAIIDKADSQRLASIIRNLDDHVQRFRLMSDQISGRLHKSVEEHRLVLDALREQDPRAAERAMRDHLESVLEDLSSSGELPASSPPA